MISENSEQVSTWRGSFGENYTDRNPHSIEELNKLYLDNFGISRTDLNYNLIGNLDRNIKILEVGCNVGSQLMCLADMGFEKLFGLEVQRYALRKAKINKKLINTTFIQGSALKLPFESNSFDLVFTSGVLIHISPENIIKVIKEIIRCSKKYIWGYEYYSENYEMIQYRDQKNLMWRADFCRKYLEASNDIVCISKRKIKYLSNDNYDNMFLLKKQNKADI